MKRLRDALGDSAETPRFVETLPRRGYRFIAPVWPDGPAEPLQSSEPEQASAGAGRPAWNTVRLRWITFATGRTTTLARLYVGTIFDRSSPTFAVSVDGQWLVYLQREQLVADIGMLSLR